MKNTILITGTSSGIGKETAKYFAEKGWNVAATMRRPEEEKELTNFKNIKVYKLDVTDNSSIKDAIQSAINDFGSIDVVVNNAGCAAYGVFEKATDTQLRELFDINLFGVFNVIREILPHFRSKGKGRIINITSMSGWITFPLFSAYHATKWSLEGFTESLHFELKPLGIKVVNVVPGAFDTNIYHKIVQFKNENIKGYDEYEKACMENLQKSFVNLPGPLLAAKVIWKAANSNSNKMRYIAGNDAKMFITLRKILPLNWFFGIVRSSIEKGFENKKSKE